MPKSTSVKPFVFVIMPFSKEFDDVYKLGIRPACEAAGAYCERVDEQIFTESILDRIFNQISKADLIVSDMSGRNPNVFYETGYAHALNKPVIHLTRNADDIPFDMKHFPHIIYGNGIAPLKEELTKRISWLVENPQQSMSDTKAQLEFYINGAQVVEGGTYRVRTPSVLSILPEYVNYRILDLRIDINNVSTKSYNMAKNLFGLGLGDWKMYRQVLGELNIEGDVPEPDAVLPSGENLYILSQEGDIYPNAWKSIVYRKCLVNLPQRCFLRTFSEYGNNDINFTLVGL